MSETEETPSQELQRRTEEARQAAREKAAADAAAEARRQQVLRGSEATGR